MDRREMKGILKKAFLTKGEHIIPFTTWDEAREAMDWVLEAFPNRMYTCLHTVHERGEHYCVFTVK